MAREKKFQGKAPEPSLREKIKTYRKSLHGDRAATFDSCFFQETGVADEEQVSLKLALTEGKNLQKAFVAAKSAVEKMNASSYRHDEIENPLLDHIEIDDD